LPVADFHVAASENLMAIQQDGLFTEEQFEQAKKDAEEIQKEFGDEAYDYEKENDLERKIKTNLHFQGNYIYFFFLRHLRFRAPRPGVKFSVVKI